MAVLADLVAHTRAASLTSFATVSNTGGLNSTQAGDSLISDLQVGHYVYIAKIKVSVTPTPRIKVSVTPTPRIKVSVGEIA